MLSVLFNKSIMHGPFFLKRYTNITIESPHHVTSAPFAVLGTGYLALLYQGCGCES